MAKAPKPYYENKTGKFICKARETYKNITWSCTGTSRKSESEARKAWQKNYERKIQEIDSKINIKEGKVKLANALPEWYDLYKRNEIGKGGRPRSQRTVRTDLDTIKQLLSSLGRYCISEIDSDMLQKYLIQLVENGNSQSTINKRWHMLSMYFNHIYPAENNPMNRCKRPESTNQGCLWSISDDDEPADKKAYTDTEMQKLVLELSKPYNTHSKWHTGDRGYSVGPALIICMYEFLRVGELVELRVKDIDFQRNIIHIRRQYDEQNKLVVPPKYGSRRDIPIMADCRNFLINACLNKTENDLLFQAGKIYTPHSLAHEGRILRGRLRDSLNTACARAGLERHTIHDLRHDGISHMVRILPDDPYSVQQWAGHRSLSVTLDKYYRHTKSGNILSIQKVTGITSGQTVNRS